MGPLAAAIIFGVGSFGVAKMSGASNKQALLAGGLGALGGAGLSHAGMLGAAGSGSAAAGTAASGTGAGFGFGTTGTAANTVGGTAAGGGGSFLSGLGAKFAAASPATKVGIGVAGASLAGGMLTGPQEGQIDPNLMGSPEEYAAAYGRQREAVRGVSDRAQYADMGGFTNQNIYAAKEGGLAEIKRFKEGGVNYLPSKTDHDEKDYNNYVRAEGYIEDGSGNGDKDEDTMLAQLADGEFVSRADAILGAGIMQGADPKDFKEMRRMGSKYFYTHQAQLKRIYDMVT